MFRIDRNYKIITIIICMGIILDRFIHALYNQSLFGIVNYSSVSYARISRRSLVFCHRPTVGLYY